MSDKLHIAICQVVAIMNVTVMDNPDLIRAHDILRVALIEYADDAVAEVRSIPQGVRDLLAVIHRDGGHHTAEVGLEDSLIDAEAVVVKLLANSYDAALQERMLVLERQRDEATSKLFQMTKERDRYRRTLGRIAEGDPAPMLVARAVLDGAEWNVK